MHPLSDQVAVVTGASSGIGKAIALALAAHGATLCLVGRQLGTLEQVAEHARATGPRVLVREADLTRDTDIRDLGVYLEQTVGSVHILVCCAGVISLGEVASARIKDFDWQYQVNVRAPYLLVQSLLPMLKVSQGQIVFINSSAGLTAKAGVAQYAATKHALKALADSLRDEVNADGIRVLSVFPGRTATPMQAAIHAMEGKTYNGEHLLQPDDVAAVAINALTLPRTAEVTNINIRPLTK